MAQGLTDRERQVLRLIFCGLANKEIAGELGITVKTVEYHITHTLGKLGAANRTQAVVAALGQGLLDSRDLRERRLSEDDKDQGKPQVETRVFPGDRRPIIGYNALGTYDLRAI